VEVELRIYAAVEGGDPFAVGGPCQHPCWNVSQRERFAAVKPAAP
jgi:hypothetical protein